MDRFILVLNIVCLAVQGILQAAFCARFTGSTARVGSIAFYTGLLCALDLLTGRLALPAIFGTGTALLLLYGTNRLFSTARPSVCWAAATLAICISQLSFGLVNAVEAPLFGRFSGTVLCLLLVAATAAALALCGAGCALVQKAVSPAEMAFPANIGYLLFPVLFFFAAESYILHAFYTQTFCGDLPAAFLLRQAGRHTALLLLQGVEAAALLCTLRVYRQFCRSLQLHTEMQLLTQAAQAQKVYIAEAQLRYEQTKQFRHDIQNHLTVLDGLLQSAGREAAKTYLQKLKTASEALSLPYQTGAPVVDILLGEKLGFARAQGITAQAALQLPVPCGIDDFDLCVIFANALDNAVQACRQVRGERCISVSGHRQGDFYLLAFENTCLEGPLPPPGTGLANIQAVAKKYGGAMQAKKTAAAFFCMCC